MVSLSKSIPGVAVSQGEGGGINERAVNISPAIMSVTSGVQLGSQKPQITYPSRPEPKTPYFQAKRQTSESFFSFMFYNPFGFLMGRGRGRRHGPTNW